MMSDIYKQNIVDTLIINMQPKLLIIKIFLIFLIQIDYQNILYKNIFYLTSFIYMKIEVISEYEDYDNGKII